MASLTTPLISQPKRVTRLAPVPRPIPCAPVETMHGDEPRSGAGDFDLCFHFVLPSYAENSSDESLLERQRLEDELFLQRVRERKGHKKHEQQVQDLFRDVFYETSDANNFKCGSIRSLKDARTVCIDLMLNFFRNDKEPHYFTYMFTSLDQDELFLCVKMLEKGAILHAHNSEYPLQLDMNTVKCPSLLNIRLDDDDNGLAAAKTPAFVVPRKHYFNLLRHHKSENDPDLREPLRKIDYIRFLYDKVTDVLDLELMKKYHLMVDYYPLHSKQVLLRLREEWATIKKWYCFDQPIHEIRNYFGENIAMYFVFAQHLFAYMVVIVGVSILVMVVDLVASGGGDFRDKIGVLATMGGYNGVQQMVPAYIAFIIVFANVFVLHLRRKLSYWMNVWGMDCGINTAVKCKLNPRFAASACMGPSEIDQNLRALGVPYAQKIRGRFKSLMGCFLFICILLCAVSTFFKLQASLIARGDTGLAKFVSFGTTVQIKMFRSIWVRLNRFLTDCEYHKNVFDFDIHCALKTQYVSFINCYCSFYYIAFVMQILGDTSYLEYGSTWQYLTYQMFTTFVLYFVFSLYDLLSPWVTLVRAQNQELRELKASGKVSEDAKKLNYSLIELQTKMENYDGDKQVGDYMDLIGVFGFVILFGTTNPLCSILAFVYIALQIRVDAWKITHITRRPFPRTCQGDFLWPDIIERYVFMAALTNIGLLCFCWPTFAAEPLEWKCLYFFFTVSVVFSLRSVGLYLFSDTSRDVELARARHMYQRQVFHEYSGSTKKKKLSHRILLRGRSGISLRPLPPLSTNSATFSAPPGESSSDDEDYDKV